ncbi:MAG: CPBP family intramembrane metalloprotease [Thermoguttaceae bacterium]|nr:CPBP family intramembrane metalloprotease [Thermoguttaceae bacterium]
MAAHSPEKVFGPADCLRFFRKDQLKATVILLYAALALTVWKYIPTHDPDSVSQFGIPCYTESIIRGIETLNSGEALPLSLFWTGELKSIAALFLMGILPIAIVKWGFREKLSDYGLRLGNRYTIQSILLFTPLMVVFVSFSDPVKYAQVYPLNPLAAILPKPLFSLHLIVYALCYYFGWEFMFRGFLLKGLAPRYGIAAAVLIQALAATMLHYGHPFPETLGCLGGSIFWGCLALRTRSILSGWVQHAALGVMLDISITASLHGLG